MSFDDPDFEDHPDIIIDDISPQVDDWEEDWGAEDGNDDWGTEDAEDEWKDDVSPLVKQNKDDLKVEELVRESSVMIYNTEKDLEDQMRYCVRPLMEMGFDLNLNQAIRIGYCYDWRIQKAKNEILKDCEKVFSNCGISFDDTPFSPESGKILECPSCYDDIAGEEFVAHLSCGHGFCKECWEYQVTTYTEEGLAALNMSCLQNGCNLAMTSSDVKKILLNGQDSIPKETQWVWERYHRLELKNFVDKCPNMGYCPKPGCKIVHSYVKGMRRDLKCSCGHQFCWRCNNIAHNPCSCDEITQWERKLNDEAEDVKWIRANTKPCPKCKTPIEKNDGCMHMTCKSAIGCGHEFCWLCMADWKQVHARGKLGGYYRCTIYEEGKHSKTVKEADEKMQQEKEELDRYEFHLKLYDNLLKDSELAKKLQMNFNELLASKGSDRSLMDVNWNFVYDSATEVARIKRMCAFIYVILYYMPKDVGLDVMEKNRKKLLQEQQAVLVTFSDKLQELISEKNLEVLVKNKSTIQNRLKTARVFRNQMSSYINTDINQDCLTSLKD